MCEPKANPEIQGEKWKTSVGKQTKYKKPKVLFCWKEMLLFSKTELGKGEPSAAKFIDALFRIHQTLRKTEEREKALPAEAWKT